MKAIALLSGGLDSTLAIRAVMEQGIEIIALNFFSPFCLCNGKAGCASIARKVTDELGIGLKMIYLGEEYLEVVRNPRHGRGKT